MPLYNGIKLKVQDLYTGNKKYGSWEFNSDLNGNGDHAYRV